DLPGGRGRAAPVRHQDLRSRGCSHQGRTRNLDDLSRDGGLRFHVSARADRDWSGRRHHDSGGARARPGAVRALSRLACPGGGGAMTLAVAIPAGQAEARTAWWRHVSSRTAIYVFLSLFALLYLLPLFVVIANSFRPLPEITQYGLIWWPRSFHLGAW